MCYTEICEKIERQIIMAYYRIKGGKKLNGMISVSGAKNAAVAIIPAVILCGHKCTLLNVPDIEDVRIIMKLLKSLGATVEFDSENNEMTIDPASISTQELTCDLMRHLRGSYYFLGALYGKYGHARIALPGGCAIGERPIDLHIAGLTEMGAQVKLKGDILQADRKGIHFCNGEINLPMKSVGTTINLMLAASTIEAGCVVITNAAKEPHIVDVANFLNAMGADVKGAGTDTITINPAKSWHGCTYEIIPDQIEAGTFMIAAAATGGTVTLRNVIPRHMESLTQVLRDCGVTVKEETDGKCDYITVSSKGRLSATDIRTAPYPGFPTDLQQPMATLLSLAEGTSKIDETIFESRFMYTRQLKLMGADIKVSNDNKTAVIHGVKKLDGAVVTITDLRAGAALVVAGLVAEGETIVQKIEYLDRGYERLDEKFRRLGAHIERVEDG